MGVVQKCRLDIAEYALYTSYCSYELQHPLRSFLTARPTESSYTSLKSETRARRPGGNKKRRGIRADSQLHDLLVNGLHPSLSYTVTSLLQIASCENVPLRIARYTSARYIKRHGFSKIYLGLKPRANEACLDPSRSHNFLSGEMLHYGSIVSPGVHILLSIVAFPPVKPAQSA